MGEVQGFPTLKYGDPHNLQDYEGGHTFEELSKFAADLGPACSPGQLQSCSEEEKAMIAKFQAMPLTELEAKIAEQDAERKKADAEFKELVDGLQKVYEEATSKKDKAVK